MDSMKHDFTPEWLAAEQAKLKPGQWLDYLPEPLETVDDVEQLFNMVDELNPQRVVIEQPYRHWTP
jgi:hypothetical protein